MLRTHLALLTSAALVSSGLGLALGSASATETETEHVTNGSFQAGATGWTSNQRLRVVRAKGTHRRVALVTKRSFARSTSRTVLADLGVTTTSQPDTVYTARIDIRGNRRGITPRLVLHESAGVQEVTHAKSRRLTNRRWQRLSFTMEPVLAASELDLSVEVTLKGRQKLRIDNVSLRSRKKTTTSTPTTSPTSTPTTTTTTTMSPTSTPTTTPTSTPTTSTPTTTTSSPTSTPTTTTSSPTSTPTSTPTDTRKALSNGCRYSTRGVPECGVLVGAAYGGNADPTAWEASMGQHLGVRRTYYNGAQVDSAVSRSATDLAAGRIPWISFKLPYTWAEMASGKGDAWTRDLATKLSRLNGPVWLAFHHEPEGDGNLAEWKAMQERLGPIVRSIAPNVAFTVILMGWHQLYGAEQYHLENIWPNTKVDIAGFDLYDWYGTYRNGVMKTKHDNLPRDYFPQIAAWSKEKGIPWGLAETGVSHPSALDDPQWMARTANSMESFGGIAFTYFNTSLNNPEGTDWTLTLDIKQQVYTQLLKAAPHI